MIKGLDYAKYSIDHGWFIVICYIHGPYVVYITVYPTSPMPKHSGICKSCWYENPLACGCDSCTEYYNRVVKPK